MAGEVIHMEVGRARRGAPGDERYAGITTADMAVIDMAEELILLAGRMSEEPGDAGRALALATAHLVHSGEIPAAGAFTLSNRLAIAVCAAVQEAGQ